eukprot:15048179-Alexandrium_andersonii.AAC.1
MVLQYAGPPACHAIAGTHDSRRAAPEGPSVRARPSRRPCRAATPCTWRRATWASARASAY